MNILFLPLSPEVLSVAIDAGCNVNQIDHSGKGFIENIYDYELHDIILSHIDKFDRRTLHVDFVISTQPFSCITFLNMDSK